MDIFIRSLVDDSSHLYTLIQLCQSDSSQRVYIQRLVTITSSGCLIERNCAKYLLSYYYGITRLYDSFGYSFPNNSLGLCAMCRSTNRHTNHTTTPIVCYCFVSLHTSHNRN